MSGSAAPPDLLPIFPLHSVLFPDGRMNLRIFEARYMDMVARTMQDGSRFGICLIAEGNEVGTPAVPHTVGVAAQVVNWDMSQPGVLGITVKGGERFRIVQQAADAQGLVKAVVEWFRPSAPVAVGEEHAAILPLLRAVAVDAGQRAISPPHRFDDAEWVGFRYAEILPIPNVAKQRLLELEDATLRLRIIAQFLADRGLLEGETPQ